MSEQIVRGLKKQIEALKSFLETLMARYLAPMTESVKNLPNLIKEQTKFVQKGFSDQIIYNLLIQKNATKTKIRKVAKVKESESLRIEEKKEYLQIQVNDLLKKSEKLCKKLDNELENRVKKLDKYALEFLDKTYNSEVKNYINEFEMPALKKIKSEEEVIFNARVESIQDLLSEINDQLNATESSNLQKIYNKTVDLNLEGEIHIKVLKVRFRKPDGTTDENIYVPAEVTRKDDSILINNLI